MLSLKPFFYLALATGGVESGVEVTFEPSKLGDSRALLTLTSSQGGEYVFPLYGHCALPRPQGPLLIRSGACVVVSGC